MAGTILAVAEMRQGEFNPQSIETVVAGQKLAAAIGGKLVVALPGKGLAEQAGKLTGFKVDELRLVEHDLLEPYTPDGYCAALRQLIDKVAPAYVIFPHTYQVRDFAPKLAAEFKRGLVSDCIGMKTDGGKVVFVRQMFQGKTNADVELEGDGPHFVSFQAGSFRADQAEAGSVEPVAAGVNIDASAIRTKPEDPFREAKQAVDLTQADIIVAIGRGIKEKDKIAMVEKLAGLLGGDIAASRPICDEGWLPMERQIGSSGQTVAPKLYLALGISGAIQHVVGMKGSRTVVAVNKDEGAPIFEIADYGIVADLFEVVPAMIELLEGPEA